MFKTALWFFIYCFAFFGSISFSYFLMRVLHPDSRALSMHTKLKYSFYVSIVSFILAAVTVQLFGDIFLFVTFPAVALLVCIFDFIVDLPKDTRTMNVLIPRYKRK